MSKKNREVPVKRPTMRKWLEQVQKLNPIKGKRTAAQIVREMRDAR